MRFEQRKYWKPFTASWAGLWCARGVWSIRCLGSTGEDSARSAGLFLPEFCKTSHRVPLWGASFNRVLQSVALLHLLCLKNFYIFYLQHSTGRRTSHRELRSLWGGLTDMPGQAECVLFRKHFPAPAVCHLLCLGRGRHEWRMFCVISPGEAEPAGRPCGHPSSSLPPCHVAHPSSPTVGQRSFTGSTHLSRTCWTLKWVTDPTAVPSIANTLVSV